MKRTPLTRKTPLKRSAIGRGKGSPLRRTALRKANPKRVARRAKQYRQVLASDFHKQLRYAAFLRSGGLCECERCVGVRRFVGKGWLGVNDAPGTMPIHFETPNTGGTYTMGEVRAAWTEIPCWFTKRGAEPWQRFRSTDGEIHHVSYAMMGDENPDELRLVRWVWKTCHERIESEHGTRRRYLASGK